MGGYKCPRCGYFADQKIAIIRHINKKKICKLNYLDVKPKDYMDLITRSNFSEIDMLTKYIDLKNIKNNRISNNEELLKENEKLKAEIRQLKNQVESLTYKHAGYVYVLHNPLFGEGVH